MNSYNIVAEAVRDFCEGENCAKDLHIVTFEYVVDYYRNNMLKR